MSRNGQPSLQQSRVSSSSSSRSQNYELIPRQQPFLGPVRDVASPKASFPFRKVQAGIESSLAHKMHNQSRSSIKGSARDVNQSNDMIDVIGELSSSRTKQESERRESRESSNHAACNEKMEELRRRIEQLQINLEQQRNQYDLERKANEIYTEGFARIREIILSKGSNFQGESIEEMVERLAEIVNARPIAQENQDVQELEKKIRDLRAQLLKSTQNNINAIFNTEISQANCLQHQVQKMNTEIAALKDKLLKVTVESQENMNRIMQNKSTSEIKKIIKIYQHRIDSESDGEDIARQDKKGKKKPSKNKLKESRESSSSDKSARKKRMASTSNHVTQLIEGFKYLQGEYVKLDGTIRQINGSQSDFKELFAVLKRDITVSIETQIKEVKETVKRPSSNTEQLKIAREIEAKLSDLMNTLNAPEKVNLEKLHQEDQTVNWKNVESVRKIADLQSRNRRLEDQVRMLSEERARLQENIMNLSKHYSSKHKEYHQLCVDSVEQKIKKSSKKGELIEQFMRTSRSDVRQQHINEQLSAGEAGGPVVHTSAFNKLHSSQSYHQSSSKHTEIENLQAKLRERQIRIEELENAIMDHLQPRVVAERETQCQKELKERYGQFINNIKMLLNQSRKECEMLRRELVKSSELSLSRANDQDRNSITLSDRTTKNRISQTRLIQRRSPKTNAFDTAKAKIEVQMALERLFFPLLEFAEKVVAHQELTIIDAVIHCIRELILESKERDYKVYEDTINHEDVMRRLRGLGIELS